MQLYAGGHPENKDGGAETRKFFLNCLCLLLGRFDRKKFETIVSEYGIRISHALLPQVLILASNLRIVLIRITKIDSLIPIILLLPLEDPVFVVILLTLIFYYIMKLHSSDDDVVDGIVCILKAVIFKPQSSGSSLTDTREVDAMLPLLIHLLDERDGTARAVVMLIAEYCLMYLLLFILWCLEAQIKYIISPFVFGYLIVNLV